MTNAQSTERKDRHMSGNYEGIMFPKAERFSSELYQKFNVTPGP